MGVLGSEQVKYMNHLMGLYEKFDFSKGVNVGIDFIVDKINDLYDGEKPDSGAIIVPLARKLQCLKFDDPNSRSGYARNRFSTMTGIENLCISASVEGNLRFGSLYEEGHLHNELKGFKHRDGYVQLFRIEHFDSKPLHVRKIDQGIAFARNLDKNCWMQGEFIFDENSCFYVPRNLEHAQLDMEEIEKKKKELEKDIPNEGLFLDSSFPNVKRTVYGYYGKFKRRE